MNKIINCDVNACGHRIPVQLKTIGYNLHIITGPDGTINSPHSEEHTIIITDGATKEYLNALAKTIKELAKNTPSVFL